jgi:hypothetical protein
MGVYYTGFKCLVFDEGEDIRIDNIGLVRFMVLLVGGDYDNIPTQYVNSDLNKCRDIMKDWQTFPIHDIVTPYIKECDLAGNQPINTHKNMIKLLQSLENEHENANYESKTLSSEIEKVVSYLKLMSVVSEWGVKSESNEINEIKIPQIESVSHIQKYIIELVEQKLTISDEILAEYHRIIK